MAEIERIGILTSGGDCAGLNAVIRAAVHRAIKGYGWRVFGIREGTRGFMRRPVDCEELTLRIFTGNILRMGGTILGTTNEGDPFAYPMPDGSRKDRSDEIIEGYRELGLDALIAIGGDGSLAIMRRLAQQGGINLVGVPKTIDNDLGGTEITFGFDTAIRTATEALEKLRTTAESHHRAMVLEVMGRNAGWIALVTGIAGGADAILIPEIPFDIDVVCDRIRALRDDGRRYSLIVVAEGAAPVDGSQEFYIQGDTSAKSKLGGIAYTVGEALTECVDTEVRVTVLGHLQRGGMPTPRDRWLATMFGAEAVHLVAAEAWGRMVAVRGEHITHVSMEDAIKMKFVDPDGDMVQVARDLGIVFG